MSYASGGLIQATDYNNLVGTSTSTTRGTINAVYAQGSGDLGYGQTAVTQSAAIAGTVTATQWTTMINALNLMSVHQGAGSVATTVNVSDTIAYKSALAGQINTIYDNRLNKVGQGSTTSGTVYSPNWSAGSTASAEDYNFTRTVDFGSGDRARYFFNCGGMLNFVTTSCSSNDGRGRSNDLADLVQNKVGSVNNYRAYNNNGRTGTGGTQNANNTGIGYWTTATSEQSIVYITSTNYPYSGDWAAINVYSSARNVDGHGDYGRYIYFKGYMHLGALQSDFGNKQVNVTWNHRIDIVYPETATSGIGNSWGTPAIS